MSTAYSIDIRQPLSEQALSVPEVARRLGVHRSTVTRWATEGMCGVRLQRIKIGKRYVVHLGALDDFLKAIQHPTEGRGTEEKKSENPFAGDQL